MIETAIVLSRLVWWLIAEDIKRWYNSGVFFLLYSHWATAMNVWKAGMLPRKFEFQEIKKQNALR